MTATRIEFHAVARSLPQSYSVSHYGYRALESTEHGVHVLLIQSGIGPDNARKTSRKILGDASWDGIISSGFAGDLTTNAVGSVLIGREVFCVYGMKSPGFSATQGITCHAECVKMALGAPWIGPEPFRSGKFASVDRVLTYSEDKQQLHRLTGAVGVDMESAAIGEIAQEHGVPFLIVRTISDGADEDLPVDFNLFLIPSGWASGILSILSRPKSWKKLIRLYQQSNHASRQLTRYFEGFFSAVSRWPIYQSSFGGEA